MRILVSGYLADLPSKQRVAGASPAERTFIFNHLQLLRTVQKSAVDNFVDDHASLVFSMYFKSDILPDFPH